MEAVETGSIGSDTGTVRRSGSEQGADSEPARTPKALADAIQPV
jgi:hypothetical protein